MTTNEKVFRITGTADTTGESRTYEISAPNEWKARTRFMSTALRDGWDFPNGSGIDYSVTEITD